MWQFTPFVLLYAVALVSCIGVAIAAYRLHPAHGARTLAAAALGMVCWIAGYILGFFNTDLAWKAASLRLEYVGIIMSPCLFFLFVVHYSQIELPKPWTIAALFAFPGVMVLAVATFPLHQLLYQDYSTATLASGFVILKKSYGPLFYIWMSYSYALMVGSGLILALASRRMPARFQTQVLVMGIIVVMILIANLTFVTGFNPIAPYDPTPLTFAVAAFLTLWNMHRYRFMDIVPVAHSLVFEQVSAGVVILNQIGNIIEINGPGAHILNATRDDLVGQSIDDVLPLSRDQQGNLSASQELAINEKIYDIKITPTAKGNQPGGSVLLMYDETENVRMQKEQEHLIAELRQALSHVHVLQGMVPICASCKNIRDDEGYWHELESYIHQHSDMKFSHGICPVCAEKLYPDIDTNPTGQDRK